MPIERENKRIVDEHAGDASRQRAEARCGLCNSSFLRLRPRSARAMGAWPHRPDRRPRAGPPVRFDLLPAAVTRSASALDEIALFSRSIASGFSPFWRAQNYGQRA